MLIQRDADRRIAAKTSPKLAACKPNPHDGIAFNEHHALDGAIVFKHACALGREGIVSMGLGSPYP
jgi:hypothetical protein